MGFFALFSYTKAKIPAIDTVPPEDPSGVHSPPASMALDKVVTRGTPSAIISAPSKAKPTAPKSSTEVVDKGISADGPKVKRGRFYMRPFSFQGKTSSDTKPALSAVHEQAKRVKAGQDLDKRLHQISKPDKRAQQSALALRSLIVGPTSMAAPQITPVSAKPQLNALKAQLMQPKSANKLILHLRALPAYDADAHASHSQHAKGPIHAVCLEHTDEEEDQLHFAPLVQHQDLPRDFSVQNISFQGVTTAPLEKLTALFNEMHIVDLVGSPDFGLGKPGDAKGLLAGAVPTAETVIRGFKQITPELMELGYATGRAITPDHSGMHPPTDRMSILTYWWGLELLLPPPSLVYLTRAQSVSGSLMNFLSALAIVNNGVKEILPFIRYIAQFVDFEFKTIKGQDKGHGVVCAATWIMPAALVPRPWDFPLPPDTQPESEGPAEPLSSPTSLLDIVAQPKSSGAAIKQRITT